MTTVTDPQSQQQGAPASLPAAPQAAAPASAAPAGPLAPEESRGFSLASLVLGLVSIVAGLTVIVPAGGLVLGILALKREPASRTMAIWGIVLNGVMLAGALLAGIVGIAFGLAVLPFLPFAFA